MLNAVRIGEVVSRRIITDGGEALEDGVDSVKLILCAAHGVNCVIPCVGEFLRRVGILGILGHLLNDFFFCREVVEPIRETGLT